MSERKLPNHVPGTIRQFRIRKRAEWRAVQKAIAVFRNACAFTPAYDRGMFDELQRLVDEIAVSLSPKWWGR